MKITITKDLNEKKKRKKRRKKRKPRAAYWWGYGLHDSDYGDAGDGGGGDGKRDDDLSEVYSEKQRKFFCASDDPELKAMCDDPMKKEQLDEKKKKGKKDACYNKVRSRYDVWPSAYASGALVKCRKVGAKNWGKSKKNEEINEEFKTHDMYDPKTGKKTKANKEQDHIELAKKGYTHVDPDKLKDILSDEGGASGLDPLVKGTKSSEEEVEKTLSGMDDVGKHEDGDYIMDDGDEVEIKKEELDLNKKIKIRIVKKKSEVIDEKKKKKAGSESSKESNLGDWFKRKGAKGKKGGWVDCNAPDGKGGYKTCGRGKGEKRKKYPACRPTPGACKEKGRGKSWGKKAKNKKKE
jgi:hypothetical protein